MKNLSPKIMIRPDFHQNPFTPENPGLLG